MNALSLFDGMSCGQIALNNLGIKVDNYFASEIEDAPIKVTMRNFPETKQLGDVRDYYRWDLPEIDLLLGGSPCQDLSRVKYGFQSSEGLRGDKSSLFWEYLNALYLFMPKYFLLENVVMNEQDLETITRELGVEPVLINSKHFTAQDRERYYWTNIPPARMIPDGHLSLIDIMERDVPEKYWYKDKEYEFHGTEFRIAATLEMNNLKMHKRVYSPYFKGPTLTAVSGGHQQVKVWDRGYPRKLMPIEYERLQGVPEGYTEGVSDTARYSMLGNGWTVPVIEHLLAGLKDSLYKYEKTIKSKVVDGGEYKFPPYN